MVLKWNLKLMILKNFQNGADICQNSLPDENLITHSWRENIKFPKVELDILTDVIQRRLGSNFHYLNNNRYIALEIFKTVFQEL